MRRYFGIHRRDHQPRQFLIANNARDMSRLAHFLYIRRKQEAIFTSMDNDLLLRVRDRDTQGTGEEYIVSVIFTL